MARYLVFGLRFNPNAVDADKKTAFHSAAKHNHHDVCRVLAVECKCDIEAKDSVSLVVRFHSESSFNFRMV
jgi:hypothetical protein